MVEALYLQYNYELKDNYVSVNHRFILTRGVWEKYFIWSFSACSQQTSSIHIKADFRFYNLQNL